MDMRLSREWLEHLIDAHREADARDIHGITSPSGLDSYDTYCDISDACDTLDGIAESEGDQDLKLTVGYLRRLAGNYLAIAKLKG